jgi:hypothetical protein
LAERYAEEEGLLFFETSAKTGDGVKEVFEQVVSTGCDTGRCIEDGN